MPKHIFFCDYCGWKKISELENNDIFELKNDSLSNKKYRCQNCGRAVVAKKIQDDPQKTLEEKKQKEKIEADNKKWIEEYIQQQINFAKEEE